jgi:GTP-binding protein
MIDGIVAIVGRPNVGKSTLFNRLTRSDAAIVDDRPGVTRDRIYGTVWLDESTKEQGFMVIDTGGFETDDFKFQPFAENLVWRQTEAAIQEADLVMLVFDGKSGLHPHDRELLRYLQKSQKAHLCIVNKIDGPEQSESLWDFFELEPDNLRRVSAAHNRGIGDLKYEIHDLLAALPDRQTYADSTGATKIAIVGRPNVGKSSILNRIVGQERTLVSDIAGTTRDSIDTPLTYNKQQFLLIDTAGIRRKSKVSERLESLSVLRSIRAIERADVVFIVLDAVQGLTDQDARLADLAVQRYKPIVFVVNKWDLFPNKETNTAKEYADAIHRQLKGMAFAPVTFVSALNNQRVHKLLAFADRLSGMAQRRVGTSAVNGALRTMVQEHTPALIKGKTKRVKFYFATQVAVNPPTIVIKCNVVDELQESYLRYMANKFRGMLGFEEIPIRLFYRPKTEEKERWRMTSPDAPAAGPDAELAAIIAREEAEAVPVEADGDDADFEFDDVDEGEGSAIEVD